MHACGVIISEEPITNFSALEIKPKGFPIIQFDMHIAEDIGFEKFDILSQRGLGTIADTVELDPRNRGVTVDIREICPIKERSPLQLVPTGREHPWMFLYREPRHEGTAQAIEM